MKEVVGSLVNLAKELYLQDPNANLTPDDVAIFCGSCAEKMRKRGFKTIKASVVIEALKNREVSFEEKIASELLGVVREMTADKWESLPKGWTKKSVNKFWGSLTGDAEHKATECIEKMKGKVDDPAAFCTSLKDKISGTTYWRGKE